MEIQVHQVLNVLRTYGHLKSLQINQVEGDRNQSARGLPDALTLSEESDLPRGEDDARNLSEK